MGDPLVISGPTPLRIHTVQNSICNTSSPCLPHLSPLTTTNAQLPTPSPQLPWSNPTTSLLRITWGGDLGPVGPEGLSPSSSVLSPSYARFLAGWPPLAGVLVAAVLAALAS